MACCWNMRRLKSTEINPAPGDGAFINSERGGLPLRRLHTRRPQDRPRSVSIHPHADTGVGPLLLHLAAAALAVAIAVAAALYGSGWIRYALLAAAAIQAVTGVLMYFGALENT